jgi:type IV fimbrial biogenesis protein FimT
MKRSSLGLTLIELVVTVAVLGVLAAAAFPAMGDFIDRQRLVSQTLAISELAQTARSEATKRSAGGASEAKSIAMTVNADDETKWFVGLRNGTDDCANALKLEDVTCKINQGGTDVPYIARWQESQCPDCTLATTAEKPIVFDLRGLIRGAAGETSITLTSPKNKDLRVRISRLGRISLCSPSGNVTGYKTCPA